MVRNNKFNPKHILEALCESRYYLIIVAIICINMANGGLLFFSAQFVQTLGNFTVTQSTLLKVAAAAIAMLMSIISGLIAWRAQQNIYTGILMCSISLAGTLILIFIPDGAIKLLGYYLSWGLAEALPMLAAIFGSNVSGYSKKIFYNGSMIAAYTISQFVGPLVMLDREKPRYTTGMIIFAAGNALAIVCFVVMRIMIVRENKQRIANPPSQIYNVNLGLTDREDRNFLYKF